MPPMPELKRDMENLKRHGFNLVKLQEHWAIDEPVEGRRDFSRYEELTEHAAALDMGVYIGLTCEQAPAWLWRKHPGCRMVGRNGLPIVYEAQSTLPGDGKPGPCLDHPGAMADELRFIRQLVTTLGAYENVVCWNTWQEIGYWGEGITGQQVCYCDNTIAFYRQWLRETYADLDNLNRLWNTRYADWADIAPPRGAYGRDCQAQEINWQYFLENTQIGRILKRRAEAIREADPRNRPVFAHKNAPSIGSGQDWTYARCQDFLGSSSYPAWGAYQPWDDGKPAPGQPFDRADALLAEMWSGLALPYDYVRSANRRGSRVWAAEFQGGPVSTALHKGRVPSADDIRRWMLTVIASGGTGISFWVTRAEIMAYEMNGFGLLDSEGDTTERFEEAARIGRALNKHADLFGKPTLPGARVAIIVNGWNYQTCAALGESAEHLAHSIRGWYRLLWDAGIPVDFVEVSRLIDCARDYKALILPFPLSLSEDAGQKLASYVERGGNLICEACPGRLNENAFCNRGELSPTMRELFGVRQTALAMVREPNGGQRWSPPERTWGEYLDPAMLVGVGPLAGMQLRANVYIETFECLTSRPCLMHGNAAAGAVREVGQGRAWLLGTFAGHCGTSYRDSASAELIRALLGSCGVAPERAGKLLLRKRVIGGKEAWILTNPTDEVATEVIDVSGWSRIADLLGGALEREANNVKLTVPALDIRVLILQAGTPQ